MFAADLPPPAIHAAAPAPDFASHRAIPFFVSASGHMLVRGEVNGLPVDMLIDSGSTFTIIDQGWAKTSGVRLDAVRDRAYGAGGGNLVLSRATGARVRIGGMELPGAALFALDLASVVAQMQTGGASAPRAIIGSDLLRRHRAIIDYPGNRLWLAPAR